MKYTHQQIVDELNQMAGQVGVLDFQVLRKRRAATGFQHMILDLDDYHKRRNKHATNPRADYPEPKGRGWELKPNGLLVVEQHCDAEQLQGFLEHANVLGSYTWFETRADKRAREQAGEMFLDPELPRGYEAFVEDYKTLGKWGENEAMDVPIVLQNPDGSMALKLITRFDNTLAFIGGILEDGDKSTEKSIAETLEEFYSKTLFASTSKTAKEAAKLPVDRFAAAMAASLEEVEFEALEPLKAQLMQVAGQPIAFGSKIQALDKILREAGVAGVIAGVVDPRGETAVFAAFSDVEFRTLQGLLRTAAADELKGKKPFLVQELLEPAINFKVHPIKQAHVSLLRNFLADNGHQALASKLVNAKKDTRLVPKFMEERWVRIKCKLYEHLFSDWYLGFKQFMLDLFVDLPKLVNSADPRDTKKAWMTTIAHYLFLNAEKFAEMERNFGLDAKGGSDAKAVGIYRLEELFTEGKMYSSHPEIVLRVLSDLMERQPDLAHTDAFEAQFDQIKAIIAARQAQALGMQAAPVQGAFAAAPAPVTGILPIIPSNVALGQYADLQAGKAAGAMVTDAPQMAAAAQNADDDLRAVLGEKRYQRLLAELENKRIPGSFKVELMRLNRNYPIVTIVIDDSGSMNEPMNSLDEQGNPVCIKRWGEAGGRLQSLLPLLALAGVRVRVTSLNGIIRDKEYDFTCDASATEDRDIATLERNLVNALTELRDEFARKQPDNTTPMHVKLSQLNDVYQREAAVGHMTYVLTDGEPNDNVKAGAELGRLGSIKNPVNFVCCTDQPGTILAWAASAAKDPAKCVGLIQDHATEAKKLVAAIPFNRNIWLALQVSPSGMIDAAKQGLALYRKAALVGGAPLAHDELNSMLGVEIDQADYQSYVAKVDQRNGVQARAAAGAPVPPPAGYSAVPSGYQFAMPPQGSAAHGAPFFAASMMSSAPSMAPVAAASYGGAPTSPLSAGMFGSAASQQGAPPPYTPAAAAASQGCPPGMDPAMWAQFQAFQQFQSMQLQGPGGRP